MPSPGGLELSEETTSFGFEEVAVTSKEGRVRGVFDSVAERYDLMNDLMSFGMHRIWKRFAVELGRVRPGSRVLDLAGGTGDLARLLARRVGDEGSVVLADINEAMLCRGRDRLIDEGLVAATSWVRANAEALPFPDDRFHCVTIAFGLRNVTRMERGLSSILRVLRPGGQALILEFSKLTVPALQPFYDAYSFKVLPRLGRLVAGDADSYRYLAESIRRHPDQDQLAQSMRAVGFERVAFFNLLGGIVALHRGYKL